jgi:hypothetical protein
MAARSYAPTSVAVAPTATTMATVDVSKASTICVHVKNNDGAQTLDCTVWRRAHPLNDFVASTLSDLAGIAAGASAGVDVDCGADYEVQVTGVASGAGLTATITVRDEPFPGGAR